MKSLIAITGLAGSGKSTAASMLVAEGYTRRKFAGPLKKMLETLLLLQGADEGTVEAFLEGDLKELPTPLLAGKSPRQAMQTLGSEWGRDHMGAMFWADITMNAAFEDKVVIDDLRFDKEAEAVRERGGKVIQIVRGIYSLATPHCSEAGINPNLVDAVLHNTGTPGDLFTGLKWVLKKLED